MDLGEPASDTVYALLGPLEVRWRGQRVPIAGARQQRLLATLLLGANRVVPIERLAEAIWDDRNPTTYRRQVQNGIGGLRQQLRAAGLCDTIATDGPGYTLRAGPAELDSIRFEQAVAEAGLLAAAGKSEPALARLRYGLGLWRGPALCGLGGALLTAAAARLDERRAVALEERFALELESGAGAGIIADIRAAVDDHPLRERLVGQLMRALHRAGRPAEALAAYDSLRMRLADELGLDPGIEVRALHTMILRGEREAVVRPTPGSVAPAAIRRPAQLPLDAAGFVSRTTELARLDEFHADGPARGGTVLAVVSGTAGVGKTAFVVHWAHRVRDRFPDGQLYVNLRGYAPVPPVSTVDAVADLLAALGVPAEQIPVGLDRATGMYRSLLADRRMLVILDDARDPDQVRALLPGTPGCMAVVTARDRLTGLAVDGARHLTIDVLPPGDARALLTDLLGARAAADPAIAGLAAACAYLPLALRIAAANLQAGPSRPTADYLADLSGDRLARLAVPGDQQAAVRDAFALSYTALRPVDRVAFTLLALVRGGDWTVDVVAALLGGGRAEAAGVVQRLTAAHLVEEPQPGRYTSHDLLREYAAQTLRDRLPACDAAAARARLLDFFLHTCDAAARLCYPHEVKLDHGERCEGVTPVAFATPSAALAWLDAELDNLVAESVFAAEAGPARFSWYLADSLRGYCWLRRPGAHWLSVAGSGLAAARRAADAEAEAMMANLLGTAHWTLGNYAEAVLAYQDALTVNRRAGRPAGEAGVLGNLAGVYREMGHLRKSVKYGRQALALQRTVGNVRGAANAMLNLAGLAIDTGQPRRAVDLAVEALTTYRTLDIPDAIGAALIQLAEAHLALDEVGPARDLLRQAIGVFEPIGAPAGAATTLILLAEAEYRLGATRSGLARAICAIELTAGISNAQLASGAATAAGNGYARLGDVEAALRCYRDALDLARRGRSPHCEIDALLGLAEVEGRLDRSEPAAAPPAEAASDQRMSVALARQALAAARAAGLRRHRERALSVLSAITGTAAR